MENLDKLFADLSAIKTPAAQNWNPRASHDINLRITADAKWHHQGAPIMRPRMVKFFASLLRHDDGGFFLATPHLKYPVQVDDAPFHAVELSVRGGGETQTLFFRTNVDEVVAADKTHPLRIINTAPYLQIRPRISAKLTRAVYFELAEFLTPAADDAQTVGVHSAGEFFPFGPA